MKDELPSITAYPNGPLIVRGNFTIETDDGTEQPSPKQTVALCRCGMSDRKPYCDGTHKLTGFRTDEP